MPEGAIEPSATVQGLSDDEARDRLSRFGPNRMVPAGRRFLGGSLGRLLSDPMVVLLVLLVPVYFALDEVTEAVVILVALVPVTGVTAVLEGKAERALDELARAGAPTAVVIRSGRELTLPSEDVVPGDLVEVREGDTVPADGRIVESSQLAVDESTLTGEPEAIAKDADTAPELWAGTTVLSGRARMVVGVTGAATRFGRIGALLTQGPPATPVQRTVRRLVVRLAAIAGVLCGVVVGLELGRGAGLGEAAIAGLSLAIATLPEEFPLVLTLYLALGGRRLAREHALVRRLAGVETLGSTTVICADKTGTLTLGRVELTAVIDRDARSGDARAAPAAMAVLEAAVSASEPDPFDPLEREIVRAAVLAGIDVPALHGAEFLRDHAFDPQDKYLSHVWRRADGVVVAAKGAVEGLVAHVRSDPAVRDRLVAEAHRLSEAGQRVIAVAAGTTTVEDRGREVDERGLELVGLLAFSDPLRPGVREAVASCVEAGIRLVMITGDSPVTAHAVAEALDLPHEDERIATGAEIDRATDDELTDLVGRVNIFARTRPEQKHRLVRALRSRGEVVAMTGDGVNDAPALREADIGVALGAHGTAVAREASTLVLLDDNFATIVSAVREGRRIGENLRNAFAYLYSFHIPMLAAALVVPLANAPLLLLPVALILLQLVVHPTVALVFQADPPEPRVMRRPPAPLDRTLMVPRQVTASVARGCTLAATVLAVYFLARADGVGTPTARTCAIVTMVVGQVVLVLVERTPDRPVWRSSIRANATIVPALGSTLAGLAVVVALEPARDVLKLGPITPLQGLAFALLGAAATLWSEPFKRPG